MKKVLFLSVCIIAALVLLPGGNAAWEECLEVSGYVQTAGSVEDACSAPSGIYAPATGKPSSVTPTPVGEAQPAAGDQTENSDPANDAPPSAEAVDTGVGSGAADEASSGGGSDSSSGSSIGSPDSASEGASGSPSAADSAADGSSGGSPGDAE